jgi:hypothetical protein
LETYLAAIQNGDFFNEKSRFIMAEQGSQSKFIIAEFSP